MMTQFFQRARSKGHELRDEEADGEQATASAAEQSSQREERRRAGMTVEDRAWEQASQQRDRERRAHAGEPTIAADEPQLSGDI